MALRRKWREIRENDFGLKFNREFPERVYINYQLDALIIIYS